MIVIASDPSISFPKAAGKKEADEFVERSLYRSASMSDHQRVTSNGTQFSGVRKSPFRWAAPAGAF